MEARVNQYQQNRLIWLQNKSAWLAKENKTRFKTKHKEGGAIEAGEVWLKSMV